MTREEAEEIEEGIKRRREQYKIEHIDDPSFGIEESSGHNTSYEDWLSTLSNADFAKYCC